MLAHNILYLICIKWWNRKTKALGNPKSKDKRKCKSMNCIYLSVTFNTKETQSYVAVARLLSPWIHNLLTNLSVWIECIFRRGIYFGFVKIDCFGESGKEVFKSLSNHWGHFSERLRFYIIIKTRLLLESWLQEIKYCCSKSILRIKITPISLSVGFVSHFPHAQAIDVNTAMTSQTKLASTYKTPQGYLGKFWAPPRSYFSSVRARPPPRRYQPRS